ncbi:Eukaryotic translation initiation factor 4B [Xylographa bjoerkii]|nr:Eukaryotic translation initiation factor 4B [Xylographa bjoerkii]
MPPSYPATPPVTPAKKPAKPPRITRAVAYAAHLQPVVETDEFAAETKAAKEVSDTASTSETNAEDSTGACVDAEGGKQVSGTKNAAETKKAPVTKKKPAVKKQPVAKKDLAANNAPANKRAAALKASEASTQAESTEEDGLSEEVEATKQAPLKKMAAKKRRQAVGKASLEAMDIDSSEQAEGSQQQQVQRAKQQRQPAAGTRHATQARPSNTRGKGNSGGAFRYPDDFPSAIPLSRTRFQGHGQTLRGVQYTSSGRRSPFYLEEASDLREQLLAQVPYVFHLEREHRLANEALELAREYASTLMDQEMNRNSLINKLIEDNKIHEENGVKFSEEEKMKRSKLLQELQDSEGRLEKINKLYIKMEEMKQGLEWFATKEEEEARIADLKATAEKKKKAGKGKVKVAETDDNEEAEDADEGKGEIEGEADDEDENESED